MGLEHGTKITREVDAEGKVKYKIDLSGNPLARTETGAYWEAREAMEEAMEEEDLREWRAVRKRGSRRALGIFLFSLCFFFLAFVCGRFEAWLGTDGAAWFFGKELAGWMLEHLPWQRLWVIWSLLGLVSALVAFVVWAARPGRWDGVPRYDWREAEGLPPLEVGDVEVKK